MATSDPLDPQPGTPGQPEAPDGVGHVPGAGGLEPTPGIQAGAYQFLVDRDQDHGNAGGNPGQTGGSHIRSRLFQNPRRSICEPSETHETSVAKGTSGTVGPAITTKSYPAGSPAARTASRSLLFARFRTTALPIRRPVTSPNRTIPACPMARTITKSPARRRRPVARTVRKLAEERSETGLSGETLAAFCTP